MKLMIVWKRYLHLDDEQATQEKWQQWTVSLAQINILFILVCLENLTEAADIWS